MGIHEDEYLKIAFNRDTQAHVNAGQLDKEVADALLVYLLDNRIVAFCRLYLESVRCFKGFYLIQPSQDNHHAGPSDTGLFGDVASEEWGTIPCAGSFVRIDFCTQQCLIENETVPSLVGWFTIKPLEVEDDVLYCL